MKTPRDFKLTGSAILFTVLLFFVQQAFADHSASILHDEAPIDPKQKAQAQAQAQARTCKDLERTAKLHDSNLQRALSRSGRSSSDIYVAKAAAQLESVMLKMATKRCPLANPEKWDYTVEHDSFGFVIEYSCYVDSQRLKGADIAIELFTGRMGRRSAAKHIYKWETLKDQLERDMEGRGCL